MHEDNLAYYRRRFEQEQLLEQEALSTEAASVHRMLAAIYAEEVRRLAPDSPPLRTGMPMRMVAARR